MQGKNGMLGSIRKLFVCSYAVHICAMRPPVADSFFSGVQAAAWLILPKFHEVHATSQFVAVLPGWA